MGVWDLFAGRDPRGIRGVSVPPLQGSGTMGLWRCPFQGCVGYASLPFALLSRPFGAGRQLNKPLVRVDRSPKGTGQQSPGSGAQRRNPGSARALVVPRVEP